MTTGKQIEINKAYLLLSGVMGRPYVDPGRTAYVFLKKIEADRFIDSLAHNQGPFVPQRNETILVDEPRYYELKALVGICMAAGAGQIKIKTGEEEETIPATIRNAAPGYYNPELAFWAMSMKTIRKTSCLSGIETCHMIVPVRITEDGADIEYGCASPQDGSTAINMAFTDLNTYDLWASKTSGWSPLEMTYGAFWDAGAKYGFVLDIASHKIVINGDTAKKLPVPNTQEKDDTEHEDIDV